eukprot:5304839-Amphidinium_carterae.1
MFVSREAVTWTQCKRAIYLGNMCCGLTWSFICGVMVVWYLVTKRLEADEPPEWPEVDRHN